MSRKAFSLAEVLVALGVLIPVFLVLAGLFPYSHLVNRQARALAQAGEVARSETERLRTVPFDSLVDSTATVHRDGLAYTVTTRVERAESDGLRRFTVTVRWNLRRPEQVVVHTLRALEGTP